MPSATTKEWEGFGSENKIMSIDHNENGFDSEIVIQAAPRLFTNKRESFQAENNRPSTQRPTRPKTASKNKNTKSRDSRDLTEVKTKSNRSQDAHVIEQFPSSRGLVKK